MIYAIGDIHGCLEPLQELLARLPLESPDTLVFLGDYIDRGPDSKKVVDFLLEHKREGWKFLRGNHEQMLLDWLDSPEAVPANVWMVNGGLRTLQAYVPRLSMQEAQSDDEVRRLHDSIPAAHAEFFRSTLLYYDAPEAFFCHAGVDLGKSLDAQTPNDLLWIREAFWGDPRPCPKLIVTGHTPRSGVEVGRDRINVDTGCVYGGPLTAIGIPGRELIQALPRP
jgi:serine/threonine protein phosphatase 1